MSDKSSLPALPESYTLNYTPHPETVTFLNRLSEFGWKEIAYDEKPVDVRKFWDCLVRNVNEEVHFDGQIVEDVIPIEGVKDGIPVTVYKPTNIHRNPSILVYFHGGGWTIGSRLMSADMCKSISSEAGCICVNVEYRLCPEVRLSDINSDARAIMRYVIQNKQKFGGGIESAVGIGGDSAGGGIAAHSSHDVPGIAYQVLIYASLDIPSTTKSAKEFFGDAILPRGTRKWFWKQKGADHLDDPKDPTVYAAQRSSFTSLPPALFIVAQLDPLRDDNFSYNEKLKAAGVQTELHLYEGVTHLFFLNPGVFKENCKRAYAHVSTFIRQFQ